MKVLGRADLILLLLVTAHVVLGAARIPGVVYARRLGDVEAYRERGAATFYLELEFQQDVDIVQWILDEVPPKAVVLWRGDYKGVLEFVPPLIAPRLLVDADSCPAEATHYLGRPLASGTLPDGRSGVLVLVAEGCDLKLEVR